MPGYEVVPQALRGAQRSIAGTAEEWHKSVNKIDHRRLNAFDLGFLGEQSGVVEAYNQALDKLQDNTTEGAHRLDEMGRQLNKVAETYGDQDAEYYRRFGWYEQHMNKPHQPPR